MTEPESGINNVPKLTKYSKKVKVIYKPVTRYISTYTCPTCCTSFVGAGIEENVLKFRCTCGQILEVEEEDK